jgi:hypothetical protein
MSPALLLFKRERSTSSTGFAAPHHGAQGAQIGVYSIQ